MKHTTHTQPSLFRTMSAAAVAVAFSILLPSLGQAAAPAPDRGTQRFEIKFMEDMIDHHFMAIQMAQLCQGRVVHPELQAACDQIIATQQQEIAEMQGWLRTWYGIQHSPEMTAGDQRMLAEMAAISGAEFEIEFMQMMIEHHSKAIKEAEGCVDKAYHPELIEMCENIIATQTAEIQQFKSWLCTWYQICEKGKKSKTR